MRAGREGSPGAVPAGGQGAIPAGGPIAALKASNALVAGVDRETEVPSEFEVLGVLEVLSALGVQCVLGVPLAFRGGSCTTMGAKPDGFHKARETKQNAAAREGGGAPVGPRVNQKGTMRYASACNNGIRVLLGIDGSKSGR